MDVVSDQKDEITGLEDQLDEFHQNMTSTNSKIDEVDEHHKELSWGLSKNYQLSLKWLTILTV